MSGNRSHIFNVRLTSAEMLSVQQNATRLEITPSEYARALFRLPFEVISDSGKKRIEGIDLSASGRVLVYDKDTYLRIVRQLRAWGNHYNQAVHALNYINSKRFLTEETTLEYYDKAMRKLTEVDAAKDSMLLLLDEIREIHHVEMTRRAVASESNDESDSERS